MSIGEKIKERRIALNLSQRDLAEMMGYSNHSTIARIEAGKVDLPQSKIVQFAEVLKISIADLMGWNEEIQRDPVATVERHFEIIMDEDLAEIFEDFRTLDSKERKIVKNLVRSLAEAKTEA